MQSAESCEREREIFGIDGISHIARSNVRFGARRRDARKRLIVTRCRISREARTGGNLRREHHALSSESAVRAREDRVRSDGFSKNFRPGPPRVHGLSLFARKGCMRRDAPKSRAKEQHARERIHTLCRSPARGAAVRAYTRARGQADRRAKTFYSDHVGTKEKRLRTLTKTITLNGGSLGSWVDEERS